MVPPWLTARPIAHRGLHDLGAGRIENSLGAAAAAVERGFGIEVDVRLTADERVVVFHDEMLDRLTNTAGPIAGRNLAELRGMRLGGSGERIPSLEELLEAVAGRVPLVIELKSLWNGDARLAQRATALLDTYQGPVALMSFDPDLMQSVAELAPDLPRGLIADRFRGEGWPGLSEARRFVLRQLIATATVRPGFIAYAVRCLPAPPPLFLKRSLGVKLLTWTVRTAGDRAVAARFADQIIFEGFDPDAP
jgi:glycerophosphoryl diester phosphodiesterase